MYTYYTYNRNRKRNIGAGNMARCRVFLRYVNYENCILTAGYTTCVGKCRKAFESRFYGLAVANSGILFPED